ncbi:uncharacterized protein LOC132283655 [Cornus florida]|uniref:uncharacterized protein LOC132283655 n=1 Tax=Cornus florida TaxID=4283 RepID=UPI0028A00FE1|nr:uncharacterized protein LOC132283655 [Cornus florida]
MSENASRTVYIGGLDERVSERVLYDILIQAGRVVDLYIPRDKETEKPKGFAFAEYETDEIANYAVRLFSGLVKLHNRTLKFAISGQDKPSPSLSTATKSTLNSSPRPTPHLVTFNNTEGSPNSVRSSTLCRQEINYAQEPAPPGVTPPPNGYRSHSDGNSYGYTRRVFGAALDNISQSRLSRSNTNNSINYPSY